MTDLQTQRSLPLPPNATQLEKSLAKALALPDDLLNIADTIQERFENPADEDLPFLIWEWGLQPILPYLSDPRRALKDGRLWQKIRGTIPAGHMARDWIDINAQHEQQQDKRFHLHLDQLVTGYGMQAVIALTNMSKSLRSDFYRITYKLDHREVRGAHSKYGQSITATMSGFRFKEDWPLLSLREFQTSYHLADSKTQSLSTITVVSGLLRASKIRFGIDRAPAKQTLAGLDHDGNSTANVININVSTTAMINRADAPLSGLPLSDLPLGSPA